MQDLPEATPLFERVQSLAFMPPDVLREQAESAVKTLDVSGLWRLQEAFMTLHGSSGARISHNTLDSYSRHSRVFIAWVRINRLNLLNLTRNEALAYARHLETQGYAPASVKAHLASTRALYATLRWVGITNNSPFNDVHAARDPVPPWEKRKPYTQKEISAMVASATPREKAIILLASDCGLRATELCTLLLTDVFLESKQPHIVVLGKRKKRQGIPLSTRARKALREWIEARNKDLDTELFPDQRVFRLSTRRSIEISVQAACERAGVEYAGRQVHGLRHSAGTRAYKETRDLVVVRDFLRHSSTMSTEVYIHHANNECGSPNQNW